MNNKSEPEVLSFSDRYVQLKSEAGSKLTEKPESIALSNIKFATEVFQPRDTDKAWLSSDSHMQTLANAVIDAPDNHLEPITIWWSGKAWYVVDGHHRLAAYRRALKGNAKLKINNIPVNVFTGSLDEAIREAAALNSRDKLPMSKDDKLERAWKLVCLNNGWTREQIRDATSVSLRSIANMRSRRKLLLENGEFENLLDITWNIAKSDKREITIDDEWKEKMAISWQKRLVKAFSKEFAVHPEIAARALQLYSERLPAMLIREWPDEVREIMEEEPELFGEPQF